MKGAKNEIFTWSIVFRKGIYFIYEKFYQCDRVPLRGLRGGGAPPKNFNFFFSPKIRLPSYTKSQIIKYHVCKANKNDYSQISLGHIIRFGDSQDIIRKVRS